MLRFIAAITLTAALLVSAGCSDNNNEQPVEEANEENRAVPAPAPAPAVDLDESAVDEQPSSVYYEIFVRSFADSNDDGIGDLKGLTSKLDYLNDGDPETKEDLGIGGIWLMPVNTSPSYHGYDVTDYYSIDPEYGTEDDFKQFIDEAHKRGIKVIMDLVVNHTSKQHPWFMESATDKDSKYRDWYVWAEDLGKPAAGSSAASGGNPWHMARDSHYLGIFWEGMPDLNFDNEEVRAEMVKIGKHWLEQGVDGFRLDAAKHIFEDLQSDRNEATVEKNIAWWNEFRSGMNEVNPEAYILGEVWEDSPVAVAPFFLPFDSSFNFGMGGQMVKAANTESNINLAFTLGRIYDLYRKSSEGRFIDAAFLTNHDQDRVMSQLGGNLDRMRMAAGLLLTIPGNPFIYYGEEIGMQGRKPDEFIREPFLWYEKGKEGPEQTSWEPSRFNVDNPPSVAAQLGDPDSLLSHYRQLIQWRNEIPALHKGDIQQYDLDNPKVESFVRRSEEDLVLVVHNMSGEQQTVDLAEAAAGESTKFTVIDRSTKDEAAIDGDTLTIPPYCTVLLRSE